MRNVRHITVASAARTVTGTSDVFDNLTQTTVGAAVVRVTAKAGTTPTLDVYVQGSYDGTNFFDIAASTQLGDATGTLIIPFGSEGAASAPFAATDGALAAGSTKTMPIPDRIRFKWVIAGTSPSYTFSIRAIVK